MNIAKLVDQGENYTKKRNYDAAIQIFVQAVHMAPNNRRAREGLRRAQLKKRENSYPNAIMVAVFGLPAKIGMFFAGLGKKGNPEGYMDACEKFLAIDPRNRRVNIALGDCAAAAGHLEAAVVCYQTAAEFSPQDVSALKRLAGLYHKTGDLTEAHKTYQMVVDLSPKDQDAIKAMRNVAAEASLRDTGFETAGSSRDLIKNTDALSSIEADARLHKTAGDLEQQKKLIEESLESAPDNVELLQDLAEVQKKTQDWDGAMASMEKALAAKPNDVMIQFSRDDLAVERIEADILELRRSGKDAEADARNTELAQTQTDAFRKRVKAYPTDLKLRFKLGELLYAQGKLDESIGEFQQTVRDPKYKSESQLRLGEAFGSKGQFDLAERQLLQALEGGSSMNDRVKEIHYVLGEIYVKSGKLDKAKEAFGKIYEVDIGYRDVADRLAKLDAGPSEGKLSISED